VQRAALGKQYVCLAQHRLGGMQLAVYCKKALKGKVQGTQVSERRGRVRRGGVV